MRKPADVFDRTHEWDRLAQFCTKVAPGTRLGLVYGRRRQGKTYLLDALAEASGGFYFAGLQQTGRQNLNDLARRYAHYVGSRAEVTFPDWDAALDALLALGDNEPTLVVIDELPYLLADAPELPSLLQRKLGPRTEVARHYKTRLVLCGSAFATMQELLTENAPLRGRANLEMVVHPFDYRDAARYWGVSADPALAVRLHALVGGTPAYRDMSGGNPPAAVADFDEWVATALLDPASAMFREGRVLLSEQEGVSHIALYFAVLTAISNKATRRSEIAEAVGASQVAVGHPLSILTETRLVTALDDAIKQKRTTFHIAEPVLRLRQLIIAPHAERLLRHRGREVWADLADTVSSKIYGPHFEDLARSWCRDHASEHTLGGKVSIVGPTTVNCREHRTAHEIDCVVVEINPNAQNRVLALGEAKWNTTPVGLDALVAMEHCRRLGQRSWITEPKLLIFSSSGFDAPLTAAASHRTDIELIGLDRLYTGA